MERKYVLEADASLDNAPKGDAPKEEKPKSSLFVRILCFVGTAFFLFFAITTLLGYSALDRRELYVSLLKSLGLYLP